QTVTWPTGGLYFSTSVINTTTIFADDAEADLGWTLGVPGDTATAGIWQRTAPGGTSAQPSADHSTSGTLCFVTDGAGRSPGAHDVDGGFTTLLSPQIDLAAATDGHISYWRWYNNSVGNNPNQDVFTIDVSNDNGATWTNVETIGPGGTGTSGGWIYHE